MTHVRVIAEVGSNHNGNIDTACELIAAASTAGADAAKFQHYPDKRYGPWPMPKEWLLELDKFASVTGIEFMCSVFDLRTLNEYVQECSPSAIKIASPELTHHHLLKAAAETGLEIILSTGMSTTEQISHALCYIFDIDVDRLTLLQCTSSYPCPVGEVNLRVMHQFDGLSDHTLHPTIAPVAAVALGATTIEKHLTLDRNQDGPDHAYALDPADFKLMVNAIRTTELMLGDGVKRVMPSEDPTARRTPEWLNA